jgi:hypothetical protein
MVGFSPWAGGGNEVQDCEIETDGDSVTPSTRCPCPKRRVPRSWWKQTQRKPKFLADGGSSVQAKKKKKLGRVLSRRWGQETKDNTRDDRITSIFLVWACVISSQEKRYANVQLYEYAQHPGTTSKYLPVQRTASALRLFLASVVKCRHTSKSLARI